MPTQVQTLYPTRLDVPAEVRAQVIAIWSQAWANTLDWPNPACVLERVGWVRPAQVVWCHGGGVLSYENDLAEKG